MPLISAMGYTYAVDGVTPNGFFITPSGGSQFVFNIGNSPGATPALVQAAAAALAVTNLPLVTVQFHCFTVSPFNLVAWCGDLGTVPANAVWWAI